MWFIIGTTEMNVDVSVHLHELFFVLGQVTYQGFAISKSYSNAQIECARYGENLASFTNQDNIENIKDVISPFGIDLHYWTGLRCTNSNNSWSFMDGADTNFAKSKIGPQCNDSDKCVEISNNGQLFINVCSAEKGFICQKGQHPTEPPTSTG